jgi:hypothetical protein
MMKNRMSRIFIHNQAEMKLEGKFMLKERYSVERKYLALRIMAHAVSMRE